MNRKIPNPFGKKGKKDHQDAIDSIERSINDAKLQAVRETEIPLANGKRRFADITAQDEDQNITEIHQVGRTNKNGSAVKRERTAIQDIETATGVRVTFHPLKTVALVVAVGVVFWYVFA